MNVLYAEGSKGDDHGLAEVSQAKFPNNGDEVHEKDKDRYSGDRIEHITTR